MKRIYIVGTPDQLKALAAYARTAADAMRMRRAAGVWQAARGKRGATAWDGRITVESCTDARKRVAGVYLPDPQGGQPARLGGLRFQHGMQYCAEHLVQALSADDVRTRAGHELLPREGKAAFEPRPSAKALHDL